MADHVRKRASRESAPQVADLESLAICLEGLENLPIALGRSSTQQRFENRRVILGDRLKEGSLCRLLADHGQVRFPNGYLADPYASSHKGRPTISAWVLTSMAVV
jgi:hypothetical protein